MILALFLLVFIFLLFYLIELTKSTTTITNRDLQIENPKPNYPPNDFSHKKYQIPYIFTKDCIWEKSKARVDKDNIYTDLMIPYKCSRCPNPDCDKVIPNDYFWGPLDNPRHCPLCNTVLERPILRPDDDDDEKKDGLDRDNDGIPTVTEIKVGLDPDNPDDALYDMDGDGFPNVFEYKQDTNIKSAASSPPLYMRLQLIEFRETLLPYKLKTVVTNNSKDPEKWDVQINYINSNGTIKTKFEYLGSSIKMDKVNYTIIKIEPNFKEERHGGTIVKIDKSKITLESIDKKYKITMQVDQDVYSPKPKAVIDDLGDDKQYIVAAGDSILIKVRYEFKGKNWIKTGKYKVLKVDRKGKQVIIEDRKLKQHIITAKPFMPRVKRKTEVQSQFGENPGAPGMLEAPPGGAPPGGVPGAPVLRKRRRNF
jgi:hypothetical protein